MDTSSLDVPNSRAITKQLLELSQDPANQPFIVQEAGCLQGLVTYSQHADQDVVVMSVRTLQFLSSHPQNKKAMREFPGLVDKLTQVSLTCPDNRAKDFSAQALINLGVLVREKNWWNEDDERKENTTIDVNRPFHTIVMQIDGLGESGTCAVAQRVLVNVKGVISVAIDKARGHALVGTRDSDDALVEKLQEALNKAGLSGGPWPPASPALNLSATSEDDDSGYIDASEYEAAANSGGALSRWGHTSLEARLAEERREEELRQAKAERLLAKVGTALTSAGAWLMGW